MKIGNCFYLRYNANDLNGINLLNGINEKDLRKNISILVIDDSDFPLQEPLETIGFKFTKKSGNEESFCINDYAEYDIILCDISGVGMKLNSKFQGAFLANEIKKAYPNKMVVLYTANTLGPEYYQYQSSLDGIIPKGHSIDDWVALLDDKIKKLADIRYQWITTRDRMLDKNIDIGIVAHLEHLFVKAVLNKNLESLQKLHAKSIQFENILKNLLTTLAVRLISKSLGV